MLRIRRDQFRTDVLGTLCDSYTLFSRMKSAVFVNFTNARSGSSINNRKFVLVTASPLSDTGGYTVEDENAKRPARLTHKWIKGAKPGRYGDGRGGHGLYIRITERKGGRITRTWGQRIRIKGQITNLGLGCFPVVSLAMARAKAADHVRRVALGEDIRKPPPKTPTLHEMIDQTIAARARRVKDKGTVDRWYRQKARCAPIGSKPVSEVTVSDVLDLIEPLWAESSRNAVNLREFLFTVMRRAIRLGYRTDNPSTSDITEDLGRPTPTVHHESLPHAEVGNALAIIRDSIVWWAVKYGLLFLALTSVRSDDVRAATREQFNLESDNPVWHIPDTKMGCRTTCPCPPAPSRSCSTPKQ